MSDIPLIDFSPCAVTIDAINEQSEAFHKLAEDIVKAFSSVGFLHLKNHGIGTDTVSELYRSIIKLLGTTLAKYV